MCVGVDLILTVHNSEEYLVDCLTSISRQTYDNLFLIIINDGSNDRSLEIINDFKGKMKMPVTVVTNKIATGVSSARNAGIGIAKHDFITFMDSDDMIKKNHISLLVSLLNKYNRENDKILVSVNLLRKKYINSYLNNKTSKKQSKYFGFCNALLRVIGTRQIQGFVAGKLFNLNYIKEKQIYFNRQLWISEDLDFVLNYLLHSKSGINYSPETTYLYRVNDNSATNSQSKIKDKSENELLAYKNMEEKILDFHLNQKIIGAFYSKYLMVINTLIYKNIKSFNFDIVIPLIPTYKSLMKKSVLNFLFSKHFHLKSKVSFFLRLITNLIFIMKNASTQ